METEQELWSDFSWRILRKTRQCLRPQPCILVTINISSNLHSEVMKVPCFYCDDGNHTNKGDYYAHHAHRLSQRLVSEYPQMHVSGADTLSENLKSILQEANAAHKLSCKMGKKLVTVHMVAFCIQPPLVTVAIGEDDEIETMKPAEANSVRSLVERKKGEEKEWRVKECVICMEEIETWGESLAMDCGHVFHEKCLCRWLCTSHVCPLCRYEMPTR